MPYIALTNQETTPKRLQQTDAKEIHNGSSPQGTAAKVYKNKKKSKTKYKPNLFKPISCTGVIFTSTHITKPCQITLSTTRQELSCFVPMKLLIRLQQMNNHFSISRVLFYAIRGLIQS